MIRRLILLAAVVAVLGLAVLRWLRAPSIVLASVLPAHAPDLANGKTMFYAGGCASCHAVPKQEDNTRLGGGPALHSAFGTFYVPNISSDRTDGTGTWSEAQFVTAMTKGTSPAREHLYPAFPYPS
jgi:cytochrome c2